MNIDKLVNEYFNKISENKKSSNDKTDSDKNAWKNLIWTIPYLGSLVASIIYALYKKSYIPGIIFYIFSLIIILITNYIENTEAQRNKRIAKEALVVKTRVTCLKNLLIDLKISTSTENINALIQAALENKPKHSHTATLRRFMHIELSGIAYFIPLFVAVLFSDTILEKIKVATIVSTLIYSAFVFILLLTIFSFLCCFYIDVIDPFIRKVYYFHDTFISDLRQLNCFRDYYGLDTKEEDNSPKESEIPIPIEENTISLSQNKIIQSDVHTEKAPKKEKNQKKKKKANKKK